MQNGCRDQGQRVQLLVPDLALLVEKQPPQVRYGRRQFYCPLLKRVDVEELFSQLTVQSLVSLFDGLVQQESFVCGFVTRV